MSNDRQVYLLDPQSLPPETIAVTFAKTSRSPESFREIAAELTDEKTVRFHEKWVVGYGHSSVAEHAILHIAIENLSRLAVESLESNRLASYTEKSTRYQTWSSDHFYTPLELKDHPLLDAYTATCNDLFSAYQNAIPLVEEALSRSDPQRENESTTQWQRRVHTQSMDVCRYFLPAASLANVGMTINARALEHALQKMLSNPLDEVHAMGLEIKKVAQAEVPTLVKYADAVPYLKNAAASLTAAASFTTTAPMTKPVCKTNPENSASDWCRLVSSDPQLEDRVLAAALYRYGALTYTQAMAHVQALQPSEKTALAESILGSLTRFDIPIREIEHAGFTFDLLMDQGAYFEFKRHRMATQSAQALTPHLGYAMPRAIVTAGLEARYHNAMEAAAQAYDAIAAAVNPSVAAYVVPNACNRRVLVTLNLRSALHLITLRTAENAHFSIRRVALRMADQIRACAPLLGAYLPTTSETWQGVEKEYFAQTGTESRE